MKKVLFVGYVELFPINAGNRRRIVDMMDLLRQNGYDVSYLFFGPSITGHVKRQMQDYFGKDKCFFFLGNKYNYWLRKECRRRLDRAVYYAIDEMLPKGLLQYVKELQVREHFDIVVAEYVMASKVLDVFGRETLKIIDTHDILTDRNKLFEEKGEKPSGIYLRKAQEIRGLKRADIVMAIQSKEASILKRWLKDSVKVVMVGNCIKVAKPKTVNSRKVLYLGSGNKLNQMGARWFIDNVLPFLKDKNIGICFAGKVCEGIRDSKEYQKLGFVDDLDALYGEMQVVINPIQGGTGLNIKTIEALGYAKPLISTSVGAKGLPDAKGYMQIADEPKEFADSIMQLVDNIDECRKLSWCAYEFATRYNRVCRKKLLRVMEDKKDAVSKKASPKVTIITICLNAQKSIEKTIKSVFKQNYPNLEYLVVDGKSSDNTLDIIKQYADDTRLRYVSEKDSGIYNAMNKGVRLANGDYIMFLNSGDELLDEDILSDMIRNMQAEEADLICGDWIKQYRKKRLKVYYSRYSTTKMLMSALAFHHMANHQTILVKKQYLEMHPFDESYKICADYLWFLQMLKKVCNGQMKFATIDRFVVNYKMDGISAQDKNRELLEKEGNRAVKQEFGWAVFLYKLCKKAVPAKWINKYLHIEE